MKLIVGDFETKFGKGYSLRDKGMTHQKYIMDDGFQAWGCGLKIDGGPSRWIPAKHLKAVFDKIDWSDACFIGHNLGFDASILAWRYGIYPARYIDTLALARAQIGSNAIKHGLDALGELLLGSGKPDGLSATYGLNKLTPEIEAQLGRYCEDDCDKTWGLFKLLIKGMTKTELLAMDWCTRVYLTPKFMLDQEVLAEYLNELAQKKAAALESVGMVDRTVLRSAEKFADALRELGVEPPTKMGKPSKKTGIAKEGYAFAKTDQAMKDMLDHPNLAVQALVAAKLEIASTNEEVKANAYYESAQLGGAWPVSIKYSGAMNTQRFSGDKHGGGNPQNLGRGSRIRDAICAPPGYKIMAPDLSQIECRISLQLGAYHYLWNRHINDPERCPEMDALDKLRNNEDIYCWFGSMIYGRTITKADKEERQLSKTAVLGLCFGMGAKRFYDTCREKGLTVTMDFAKLIVKLYRKTFPNVVKAWKASLRQLGDLLNGHCQPAFRFKADPTGPKIDANAFNILTPELDPIFGQPALRMPNGQYLKYPLLTCETKGIKTEWSYWNKGIKTYMHAPKSFENVAQALAGMLCRDMLVELEGIFRTEDPSMGIELQVHDELVGLIYDDPDWLAWAHAQFLRVMQKSPSWMPELPVACEIKEGYRYGEIKEEKWRNE
jgi:DNA polymerase bacteriophage-type